MAPPAATKGVRTGQTNTATIAAPPLVRHPAQRYPVAPAAPFPAPLTQPCTGASSATFGGKRGAATPIVPSWARSLSGRLKDGGSETQPVVRMSPAKEAAHAVLTHRSVPLKPARPRRCRRQSSRHRRTARRVSTLTERGLVPAGGRAQTKLRLKSESSKLDRIDIESRNGEITEPVIGTPQSGNPWPNELICDDAEGDAYEGNFSASAHAGPPLPRLLVF